MEKNDKELEEYIDRHSMNSYIHYIEMAIEYKFRGIEDLTITLKYNDIYTVSFLEGKYSKEEVETYVKELLTEKY